MLNTVGVTMSGMKVGSVTFDESPASLRAYRTAGGFRLFLPITVLLRMEKRDKQPFLCQLRGMLSAQDEDGAAHPLGEAYCHVSFVGADPESRTSSELVWSDALSAITYYERVRAGRPPRFRIALRAEACYLLNHQTQWLRSAPAEIAGDAEVGYPTHAWIAMLRDMKVAENVLVEVPLPGTPPIGWEAIWEALIEARRAFEDGGQTGYSQCVVKVRHALELWNGLEPERKLLAGQDVKGRTREERLDGLRWHLHQCAHLAAHPGGGWSRDEALLMLSTLSAMLALRRP